ncbi:MAG: dihydropteroate synthase [Deltaproteobacteria bacterium]|nr:dihydropteroate synthase [Deltaproteobacteria bacterium]
MLLIADNLQIIHSPVADAVAAQNVDAIAAMVQRYVAAGAQAIDINAGPLPRDAEKKMAFLVRAVRAVTGLPLVLDTVNPAAIAAGLGEDAKNTIINGFSLEPARLDAVLPLAQQFNATIIGYLLRADGHVPADADERLKIAGDLYQAFESTGLDRSRLIIDPVLVPLSWRRGTFQAREVLNVIRYLPDLLGFQVKTVIGLSNLTAGSGKRSKRVYVEQAYLALLAAAGLDMALVNVLHQGTVRTSRACRDLLSDNIFVWEEERGHGVQP